MISPNPNSPLFDSVGHNRAAPAIETSAPAVLASDFETFLKMLTAQARYQDPMDPMDSSAYAAQLAQFSMVEQQVQTNNTLAALVSQIATSKMASLAGWIGLEVRSASAMQFNGNPITLFPSPAALADRMTLVVADSKDVEIQRLTLPISAEPIEWAGMDENGAPLPSGLYNFSLESYRAGELILTEPVEIYGKIIETQVHENEIILILEGGQIVPSSAVTALRRG
ncbi:flagellar hook capping FlgD N-terminal domain-containing protein [Pontibaca salina]|uniref:Basal-body rod modification protein FlgD n=1 Tax=Pontibaca salina TaxID=2795731 RepID=A0A934HJL2_9RHOB|nr:flagellar hook capping FlgD N-terminal domain-containing protein [Pontibaca salina]MBI6629374.1 flagellar hook assembly protein FlgD [Pontibaca salina]